MSDLANSNPIRYRGYYYDREIGLYYCNARYYNPEWRRFISPDDTSYLDPENVNGLNLYAYCYNDPVNYADPSGNFVISAWVVGMVVGFGVGFASSVVSDLIFENAVNWKKAIVSGLFSSVSGALANIAIPFEALVLSNALLSAGNSIVDDIFFDKNENVANIIGNALICAGMSALFTLAIGDPNSKRITELYSNAKYADHMLHKGGLHPNVKVGYNKDIAIYNKELKKIISNSIEEALTVSPFEKFFARIYKLYYKSFFVR
jgi:RHS repeat-associated protein